MRVKTIAAAAVLALAAGGGAVAAATAAAANTTGCLAQTPDYCGSQLLDQGGHSYALDVYQQKAAYNQPVVIWNKSDTDPAQDWDVRAPQNLSYYDTIPNPGNNDGSWKTFEYAPGGHDSGYCMAMPNDASNGKDGPVSGQAVVLRPCNSSPWQVFIATDSDNTGAGSGVYWRSAANCVYDTPPKALALTDTHRGGAGEQQTAYAPVDQSNQFWTADYSQP
jgi:hypothetical protein